MGGPVKVAEARRPPPVNAKARARLFGKSCSMANLEGRPQSPMRLGSPGESMPSNNASNGKYGLIFDGKSRTFNASGIAERAEKRKRAQRRFKMAYDLVGAVRAFQPDEKALAKHSDVAEALLSAGRRTLRLPDIPTPTLSTPRTRIRSSVICEVCNGECDHSEAGATLRCFYCPNVIHERCRAREAFDWSDPLGNDGRTCCHICSGNLAEMRAARDRAFDDARADHRQGMANDILTRAVRAWLSQKRFQERKAKVVKAQSVVRRYLFRSKFIVARGKLKRAIAVRLKDIVVSSLEPLPEFSSVFGILTVLDHTQRMTLFSYDLEEVPLVPRRDAASAKPRKRRPSGAPGTTGRRITSAEAEKLEIEEAREHLKRSRTRTPFHLTAAKMNIENVLPGSTYDITVVFTVFLKTRTGLENRMEISHLLGQGAYHIRGTPEDLARFDGSTNNEWLAVEVKPHMRYPLRGQSREEMRDMVSGVYRGYVKAELRVQIEGLNSLYNMTTWLEAPHFETLKKSEGAASAANSKGGRKQLWWAALCNGLFTLYTSQGDTQARVSVLAHKATVDYERLPKSHAFSITLPDKRNWAFAPLGRHEAANWIFAFEYWRLKHAHSHAAAIALMCAPSHRKTRGRHRHGNSAASHAGGDHDASRPKRASENRRRSSRTSSVAASAAGSLASAPGGAASKAEFGLGSLGTSLGAASRETS